MRSVRHFHDRIRRGYALALAGYGWEDLVVKSRAWPYPPLSPDMARLIVYGATEEGEAA